MQKKLEHLIHQDKALQKTLQQVRESVKEAKDDNERKKEHVAHQVDHFKKKEYDTILIVTTIVMNLRIRCIKWP